MKKFIIEIQETLAKIIEINANSEEEAISTIQDLYRNERIILNAEDYISTEIRRIQNER